MKRQFLMVTSAVTILLMAGAGCPEKDVLRNPTLARALTRAGWTPADFPRELLGVGAIVSVTTSQGISYRGHLKDCMMDGQDFRSEFDLRVGNAGLEGKIDSSYNFDASALLDYQSVEVGPKFSSLKKFTLTLGPTKEYAISDIKVRNWISTNWDALTPACKTYLRGYEGERPDVRNAVFILTDVLGTEGYRYAFQSESGTSVNLTTANIAEYFSLRGDVAYTVSASGDLKVDGIAFIAFKDGSSPFDAGQGAAPPLGAVEIMKGRLVARGVIAVP